MPLCVNLRLLAAECATKCQIVGQRKTSSHQVEIDGVAGGRPEARVSVTSAATEHAPINSSH